MSTKQTVIFIFMLIFLAGALTTLGMWFHYRLEVDIKKKTMTQIGADTTLAKKKRDGLRKQLNNPETPDADLSGRLQAVQKEADQKYAEVWVDQLAVEPAYRAKLPEIETEWKASGGEWTKIYEEWTKKNGQIREAMDAFVKVQVDAIKRVDDAKVTLAQELTTEETQRKQFVEEHHKWEDELGGIRYEGEDLLDKINHVTRELERTSEQEVDGRIIHSTPSLALVTVDLGYQQGAQKGMRFQIYSGKHTTSVLKGELMLTEIHAASSEAVVLPTVGRPKWDPQTGYEAADPRMRYSPLSATGPEESEPMPLEKMKSKKDLVDEIRLEQIKRELGPEEVTRILEERSAPTQPPLALGKGFDPIIEGDWISNTEFVRIETEREWQRKSTEELMSLKEINLGSLTLYLAETIRPYRREFLKRLCERNRCKAVDGMSPDVDFIVTTTTTGREDLLERELEPLKEKQDVSPEVAAKRITLAALKEGRKFGSRVLTEEELEAYFIKRQRKNELAKGKAIQPGQYIFFVVGETKRRSVRETGLYIKEHGGAIADSLDAGVDYVVVGAGLTDAKLDKKSGRLYYPGQDAPEGAVPFYDAMKQMGLKILREEELDHFFGQD